MTKQRINEVEIAMAELKTDIKHVVRKVDSIDKNTKDELKEIKKILNTHCDHDTKFRENLNKVFAAKWVETALISVAATVIAGIILLIVKLV